MTGVVVDGIDELSIHKERETIAKTREGFAHYKLREGGSRARNLQAAYDTLAAPSEVWTDNPKLKNAKWVYIREYDSKPYPYSVALVGEWETNSTVIVPFSGFPVKRSNIKKWRQLKRIYP